MLVAHKCEKLEAFVQEEQGISPEYGPTLIRDCWSNVAFRKNDPTVCDELKRTNPENVEACGERYNQRKENVACETLKKTDRAAGNACFEKLRITEILERCERLKKNGAVAEYEACMKYAQQ